MIKEDEVSAVRKAWGEQLIKVSKAYETGGIDTARRVTSAFLDAHYGYALGPVLFKPTMASGDQTFRPTKAGALAYFCSHSDDFPRDGGFALNRWRAMESVTSATFVDGDVALWMGWISLTQEDGEVTTVDKSFGYKKDASGVLRIVLHHSSLPYEL